MKTVKDLIEYLKTKDQGLPLVCQYDGYIQSLNVFEYKGRLVFSESKRNHDYEDAAIEFTSYYRDTE